jgi:hypothetical protein
MQSPKRRKLSHSPDPGNSSERPLKQPTQPPNLSERGRPNERPRAGSHALDQGQHKLVYDDQFEQPSPTTMLGQPQAVGPVPQPKASPQAAWTQSSGDNSTPHSPTDLPPDMMLFPISQSSKCLTFTTGANSGSSILKHTSTISNKVLSILLTKTNQILATSMLRKSTRFPRRRTGRGTCLTCEDHGSQ